MPDGRQSATAANVQRGTMRLLHHHGFDGLTELTLRTGRRADIAAINPKGQIAIVEIKSSLEDFQSDTKWQDYLEWGDQFYFAVPIDFPTAVLPADEGLIIADQYGGEIVRPSIIRPLAPARRKAVTILFASTAAKRIFRMQDPDGPARLNT
ncbi:MAG: DNA repair protein MmcB-related protein [Alphaproteobacteria bacterium]|nr:MAG: DNA repair protein MmcB-related protein [Alphaproteobacteria bacterium]